MDAAGLTSQYLGTSVRTKVSWVSTPNFIYSQTPDRGETTMKCNSGKKKTGLRASSKAKRQLGSSHPCTLLLRSDIFPAELQHCRTIRAYRCTQSSNLGAVRVHSKHKTRCCSRRMLHGAQ